MGFVEEFFKLNKNVDKFVDFSHFFVDCAKTFNLTSITDEEEVCIKHLEDSLAAAPFIKQGAFVVEIGSGGGFPSVPLKIERSDLSFTLIEATQKKCNYLREVGVRLGFDNFTVLQGRAEELSKKEEFREKFDCAVARAVAPLNCLVEYLLPYLKVGGIMIAYKGANYQEEVDKISNGLKILGGKLKEIHTYDLSKDYGSRALVIIEKVKATPLKYPRLESKIRKTPL